MAILRVDGRAKYAPKRLRERRLLEPPLLGGRRNGVGQLRSLVVGAGQDVAGVGVPARWAG
jgi:hypothetical protein